MWQILFIDQPEYFNTINIVGGWLYKNISVFLTLGISLIIVWLAIFLFGQKKKLKFSPMVWLGVIAVFWLPSLINSYYNNINDVLRDDWLLFNSNYDKSFWRICQMEKAQMNSFSFCRIGAVIAETKTLVEPGAKLNLIVADGAALFFNYYLYLQADLTRNISEAQYVLLYYPTARYYYDNKNLYQFDGLVDLGKFSLVKQFAVQGLLLKRVK